MTNIQDKPRVSVGLAVYNGEKYLEKAIDSILAQTFTDLELIISDNASDDKTQEICIGYLRQDHRVKYHRNTTNIGGANNENLTFKMSRGEYFRWAAHDDICHPELIGKCVQVLDNNPEVVLCHSTIVNIDSDGNEIRKLERTKAHSTKPYERFIELTGWDHDCEETYGLIRSRELALTGLQRNYTDSDRTLLCHLSLLGQFHHIPEPLFYKRIHENMSTQQYVGWRERMEWFGEVGNIRKSLPHWTQFLHYLEVITESPISIRDKLLCYSHMLQWVFEHRRWGKMGKDLVYAGKAALHL